MQPIGPPTTYPPRKVPTGLEPAPAWPQYPTNYLTEDQPLRGTMDRALKCWTDNSTDYQRQPPLPPLPLFHDHPIGQPILEWEEDRQQWMLYVETSECPGSADYGINGAPKSGRRRRRHRM